jgi:hypothetical protein
VATLGRAPQERSTPEIRDKRLMIPLERKLAIQRNLLVERTSSYSRRKWKKRNHSKNHNLEEFKKAKPPSFDGEIKKGEEAEA